MARRFLDLLTVDLGSGGVDSVSRLALVSRDLGYHCIGIVSKARRRTLERLGGLLDMEIFPVRERRRRGSDSAILYASGGNARRAASSGLVDFIIPDHRDSVSVRYAAENQVAVAYPYTDLLVERSVRRANVISRWSSIHLWCSKYGATEIAVSFATDSYLMRGPRDVSWLISACLGLGEEEALDWTSTNPMRVVERASERRRADA